MVYSIDNMEQEAIVKNREFNALVDEVQIKQAEFLRALSSVYDFISEFFGDIEDIDWLRDDVIQEVDRSVCALSSDVDPSSRMIVGEIDANDLRSRFIGILQALVSETQSKKLS